MAESKNLAYLNPAPKNPYGVFCQVCDDVTDALSPLEFAAIIDGPVAAMEPKLQEELAKVITVFCWDKPYCFGVETPKDIRNN